MNNLVLISFFDEDPLDNIGDVLYFKPDTCIFVGESSTIGNRKKKDISAVLNGRKIKTNFEFYCIPAGQVSTGMSRLEELIQKHENCILDVTGGTEMLIALAGMLAGKHNLPIYQRKDRSGRILWQMNCDLPHETASLTVAEVITLHSAAIKESYPTPDPKSQLAQDLPVLWEVARKNPGAYNSTCNALSQLWEASASGVSLDVVVEGSARNKADYIDIDILNDLEKTGFLQNLNTEWGGISFRFRDWVVKDILTKAGNLLELITWLAASFAHDRLMGVKLDWDGRDLEHPGNVQTTNELDVILTVGMVPVFISCKNGVFDREALYELDTVSRHFGGRFAKRILVTSSTARNHASTDSLVQRARDMDIIPLFDVHEYNFEDLSRKLRDALLSILR